MALVLKRCFKCGEEKPIDDFYAHPQMGDKHLGKCKECTRLDVITHRKTNPNTREYDRLRSASPHRASLRARITKRWRQKYPERERAQRAADRAVKSGQIKAPLLCDGCGLLLRL